MRSSLSQNLAGLIQILIGGLIFLLPIFFLTSTTNVLEYPKVILLLGAALLLLPLWAVKSVAQEKLTITKSPLDVPLLLLGLTFILSTWFSLNRSTSVMGFGGLWHWSLLSALGLISFYYIVVSNINSKVWLERMSYLLLSVGAVLGLGAVLGYLVAQGLIVPGGLGFFGNVLTQLNFNLTGGTLFLVLTLVALLPIAISKLLESYEKQNWPAFTLNALYVMVFALGAVLWISPHLPGLDSGLEAGARLGLRESWIVSISSLRDNALLGSGPATFLTDFTQYRPAYLNQVDYWGVRFTKPFSEYLDVVATLGLAGLVVFLLLVWRVTRGVLFGVGRGEERKVSVFALGALIILVGWIFMPSNIVTAFLLFTFLALWMVEERLNGGVSDEVVLSFATTGKQNTEVLPWVFLVVSVLVSLGGLYSISRDLRSNVTFANSVRLLATNASGIEIYNTQRDAINLNPYRASYRRSYAQTNLALASAIAGQGRTQEQPAQLTEQDRANISSLVQESIRQVRVLTEALAPLDVRNWEARGQIYSGLIGVAQDAEGWAINAYRNALQLDPTNPLLYARLGGLYMGQENYAAAQQNFATAVNLKPDLPNAHFNLAVALQRQEKFKQAKEELVLTQRIIEQDGAEADKERVQTLLDEVEAQITPEPTPTVAPAQ